jgi:ribosome maturation protein SDO1
MDKGELQVSTKEREHQSDNLLKDISVIISERCMNPTTGRPYTASMIEKAVKDLHISLKLEQSAKQQALEVLKMLEKNKNFPITRAQLHIKVQVPASFGRKIRDEIILENGLPSTTKIVKESWELEDCLFDLMVDPGKFRILSEQVAEMTKGEGSVFAMTAPEFNTNKAIANNKK